LLSDFRQRRDTLTEWCIPTSQPMHWRSLGLSGPGKYLFCTLQGSRMSYSATQAMLKRRAAKAGIETRAHLHGLRHSHAAEMRQRGVDVVVIQKRAPSFRIFSFPCMANSGRSSSRLAAA
jgi:integrase